MTTRQRTRAPSTASKNSPRNAEETQKKLLEAARHLFAEQGLHGTSVAQIAARAGVSSAMINHHFGGKEGLYRACLAGFAEARLQALGRFLDVPKTQDEMELRVELLVGELLDVHIREPEIVAILLRDTNASESWGADVERALNEFPLRLAAFFAQAKAAGLIDADVDPMVPAGVIYLSLTGLVHVDRHGMRITGKSLKDAAYRKGVVKQLLRVVWHGVLPSKRRERG
jgi:AcrR family transcriptional regulator